MSKASPATAPRAPKYPPFQEDWLSKTLAGTLLGAALALITSSLFAHWGAK